MWFVLSLLMFEGVYLIYRKISAVRFSGFFTEKFPSTSKIIYFTIACAILAFVFRLFLSIGENVFGLQLGYFTLYMAFYVMGMVASRKNWLEKLSYRNGMVWFGVSMFLVIFIFGALIYLSKHPDTMPLFVGGWHLQSLMLTIWEAFTCVGISYFLLVFFKRHFNFTNNLTRNLAANSYAVYFIHPPVVVGFTMLLEHINLLPELKFLLAAIMSFAGCILLANLMRLIPGMKRIL
ncbi:MAG: acyltransferase [Bacteroidales bacterium]|nr:acyltransferase [Bacteroidales bacterium]